MMRPLLDYALAIAALTLTGVVPAIDATRAPEGAAVASRGATPAAAPVPPASPAAMHPAPVGADYDRRHVDQPARALGREDSPRVPGQARGTRPPEVTGEAAARRGER